MFRRIPCSANATAFVLLTIVAATSVAQERPDDPPPTTERIPNKPSPVESSVTPTDVLIDQIKNELRTSHRPLSVEEFARTHTNIATLIGDLRKVSPDDPHVAQFLPERWLSLKILAGLPSTNDRSTFDSMRELNAELDEVLKTTTDSRLRSDALFYQTIFKINRPIDGPAAVALAERFVSEWPKDNRSAEVLHIAVMKLHTAWYLRVAIIALFVVISAVVAMTACRPPSNTRKWLRLGILFGLLGIGLFILLHTTYPHFPGLRKFEAVALEAVLPLNRILEANILSFVGTYRFWLIIVAASTTALLLVAVRQRSEAAPFQRFSKMRQLILGFSLAGALCFSVDTYLISRQSTEVTRRIAQEYPNSLRGRLAQGETRKRERIGEPFELEFTDAISGQVVSMKNLRGKVVVVNFWATWCGPCVGEIPELKQLYAQYHDQGVEFIGVSHDPPENAGGLEKLKSFVDKEQIPWPQYYLGRDDRTLRTGSPQNDFSELWGIDGIPVIFLIDPSGNLYSTEARGQLDTLIPRLLKK
ncbi:TlpA family protein disulfide reductase [Gimesia aquarii]|uniref:Thiol-disulfide oxidoreductase ResA n=1 Tax=Gimesia aquarii TaxID=2527964 RepID=A0A517VQS7_9PLAN|nr:TlpA disulfide reductase family protein [Gimesia aquarii]QDT95378.1 Thiol-disulfide oxidoreductase ResA [Gimesia aquarii]